MFKKTLLSRRTIRVAAVAALMATLAAPLAVGVGVAGASGSALYSCPSGYKLSGSTCTTWTTKTPAQCAAVGGTYDPTNLSCDISIPASTSTPQGVSPVKATRHGVVCVNRRTRKIVRVLSSRCPAGYAQR